MCNVGGHDGGISVWTEIRDGPSLHAARSSWWITSRLACQQRQTGGKERMTDKGKREKREKLRLSPLWSEAGSKGSCCLSMLAHTFVLTEVKVWQRCGACWISLDFRWRFNKWLEISFAGCEKNKTKGGIVSKRLIREAQHLRSFVTMQPRRAPENLSFQCLHRWPQLAFCSCSFLLQ